MSINCWTFFHIVYDLLLALLIVCDLSNILLVVDDSDPAVSHPQIFLRTFSAEMADDKKVKWR